MAICRIQTVFAGLPGLPGLSSLYFQADTQDEAASAHAAVSGMWIAVKGNLRNSLTMTVLGEIACLNEETGDLIEYFAVTPTNYSGALSSSEVLPYAVQGLMHFSTPGVVHNRRVAGRMFVPGFTEDFSVAGEVSPGFRDAVANAVQSKLQEASTNHVVWSRPFEGSQGNPARPGSVHAVTSTRMNSQWSVLRSRRP